MSLESDTIQILRRYINSFSKFSEEDKKLWLSRIDALPYAYAAFLINAFEESPEDIERINANFKEKARIAETGDREVWANLLKQEEEELLRYVGKI